LASAGADGTVRLWDAHQLPAEISRLKLGVPVGALIWGAGGVTAAAQTGLVQLTVVDA
jgi:hypothetical protein